MNTHPSDTAAVIPFTLTETVQARGEVSTRIRQTVQDVSKLAPIYLLDGETMTQKVESLRSWVAANRVFNQLELLAYIEDILSAPTSLGTYVIDEDSLG